MFRKTELFAAAALLATCTAAASQEVIATLDGESPGKRIEITELSRTSGNTVTLKYHVFNETRQRTNTFDLRAVDLIDIAGRKKYLVITDSRGECLCSTEADDVDPGQVQTLWARFPAPPLEVKEVSVVFPGFIPTDVPISE